ncbi:MAG: D-tyrosyl-tRNA(Tyr) deacylase [Deltaproteobacteria bacterium]|nr:D-tyrosyl-tRNA(Tyr) deacylase [Deltaproteobacteria bacterium]
MRAVVQRVKKAAVYVNGQEVSSIGNGLCCLIGVALSDGRDDIDFMARKICTLRIFDDVHQMMNRDISEVSGDILLISQFTLLGDARKGRRPSYTKAEQPETARAVFDELVDCIRTVFSGKVVTGTFQAMMDVDIINHGPITILLDSRKQF